MNNIKKLLVTTFACLLVGCSHTSTTTYTYTDSITIPSDMISSEDDIEISGTEEMTLYHENDEISKIDDVIEYTFDSNATDNDKKVIKEMLLDSFTEEEGIEVQDNSSENVVAIKIVIDLNSIDKTNEIIQMFNMNGSDFNENGTYPLKILENALIEAGYTK